MYNIQVAEFGSRDLFVTAWPNSLNRGEVITVRQDLINQLCKFVELLNVAFFSKL
jgi:hypothetical protein